MKKIAYLATPYSDKDPLVKEERFQKVNKVAAKLIKRGEIIFSPISHTHPIAMVGNLPGGWEYWDEFDRAYLSCCYKLYVLMLDGWKESSGTQAEIKIAEELGLEIEYLDYGDLEGADDNLKHIAVKFEKDTSVDWYVNDDSEEPCDIGHIIQKGAYVEFDILRDNGETLDVEEDYGVIKGLRKDSIRIEE